ncbi:MAG TPA: hydrogen gas-evolving membrane-bound hydrogenase subunit E [Tepidisphaeraceae bacterium]|nr:hydrogen gas-evolving membrane-bound hydrogenase subunit E [Tepidisphaeraceae bacterium]
MPPVLLLSLAIFAPAVVGAATLALPRRAMSLRVLLCVLAPVASLVLLALLVRTAGVGAEIASVEWMPAFRLNLDLHADALSLFFALLVAAVGVPIAVYARAYFGPDPDDLYRFYPSLHLFMTAMLGLVLSDNFLLLLLFWELTSISSFLLIGWERDDQIAVKNALQAFVITNAGGLALMAAFVLLGIGTGAWSFSELRASIEAGRFAANGFVVSGFVLVFVGAAAKSAQWPVHFWLPGAMAAPTPVSAYLHSATMVKAGVYLIGRCWPLLAALSVWPRLIIPIGALTMVLGAYVALRKSDLKQIFAYSTVSQLGLLMTMYGLGGLTYQGEPNLLWDVTQILNHALYKAPLFILAGAIGHAIHTRELPMMRGLVRRGGQQGIMAALLIAAAYALAALPFTLSFTAKEFFFYQIYHAFGAMPDTVVYLLMAAGVATGMFNVAIFVRLARVLLDRPEESPHERSIPPALEHPAQFVAHHDGVVDESPSSEDVDVDVHERGFWRSMLWAPAALLVAFQFISGIVPGAHARLFGWLERPASLNYTFDAVSTFPMTWDVFAHPGVPLYMSGVAIVLGLLLGFAPVFRSVIGDLHERLFPAFYRLAVDGGAAVFAVFQTGYFRTYALAYALAMVLVVAAAMWRVPGYLQLGEHPLGAGDTFAGLLLAGLMCAAALLLALVRNRAGRVLVLGVAGVAATGLFYMYRAPDLALTQISIEVVSLILFLLVLALLPDVNLRMHSLVAPRVVVALLVGVTMALLTLTATTGHRPPRVLGGADGTPFVTLGNYFLRNSYVGRDTIDVRPSLLEQDGLVDRGPSHPDSFGTHPRNYLSHTSSAVIAAHEGVQVHKGGGGANVVNVILVDFRGFDTLGEITVLSIAALGVWTLLRRHRGAAHAVDAEAAGQGAELDVHPVVDASFPMATTILLQAAKLLVPLALLVSTYIFFKGHQTPGGGFVGGLVAAVALILYRMCAGGEALRRLLPVRERTLIAAGLFLAAGTGTLALLLGLPFLTSNNGYLPLPGGERFHWASVAVFDAGVFLVVVGVTVGMIDALSREIELERTPRA